MSPYISISLLLESGQNQFILKIKTKLNIYAKVKSTQARVNYSNEFTKLKFNKIAKKFLNVD